MSQAYSALLLQRSLPESINFSSCGSYFILVTGGNHRVLPLPQDLLQDEDSQLPELRKNSQYSDEIQQRIDPISGTWNKAANQLVETNQESEAMALAPASTGARSRTLSAHLSGGQVQLALKGISDIENVSLTRLPAWPGLEQSKHEVILPCHASDTLKISIDKPPRKKYPLSESQQFFEIPPMMIERDPRFIIGPPSIQRLLQPVGRAAASITFDDTAQQKRKRELELQPASLDSRPLTRAKFNLLE